MPNTYSMNIPALPALGSGVDDNSAHAIAQNDILDNQDVVAATRQYKNRKNLRLMDPPQATDDEVIESKRRKHCVQSANFDGDTPAWAQQMQQQMQDMQQQMQQQMQDMQQQMQQKMQDMQQQMQGMQQQMKRLITQESQRSRNFARRSNDSRIHELVRVVDGQTPTQANVGAQFPVDFFALSNLTGNQVDIFLNFYSEPMAGTVAERRDRLGVFLGVVL